MQYTSKLKLLILLIAILPPLIIVSILKFSIEQKIENEHQNQIGQSFEKADNYILSEQGKIKYAVQQLVNDSLFLKIISSKKKLKEIPSLFLQKYDLTFIVIVNDSGKTILSNNNQRNNIKGLKKLIGKHIVSKEIDSQGHHASLTYIENNDSGYYIYAGKYIDQTMIYLLSNLSQSKVTIEFGKNINWVTHKPLIETENGVISTLLYSPKDEVALQLDFRDDNNKQLFSEVLQIISIVTACMMLFAILIGLYLTGKTKKEIDNLRTAFANVAGGNFDTTVMAYEKSEFSELADSFSEMVSKLKTTQSQLSTVEKIAAWETVGRRLAHEIKNPLSPISIAADDLRSSYFEKLPNFDKTLEETTTTIKKEVRRMTMLLDEFVSFARMKQSNLRKVEFRPFVDELQRLYAKEIRENKLHIKNKISKTIVFLDKDTFLQLCINLIKNGFESNENSVVDMSITNKNNKVQIVIADNGPGFSKAKLTNSFMPFETTKIDGSGLGLVICHRIILDHNGTMTLQNRKDKGGEVVITLPIA